MKKLIIILGTILLGAWIVTTLFMGDTDPSLKNGAETVIQECVNEIDDLN